MSLEITFDKKFDKKIEMNIVNIPKDVVVVVLKKLSLKELIGMRLINKYFNTIVKEKFRRLWFKKYIDIMTRTGNYGKKYDVPVKKIHKKNIYIKELDLEIPFVTCYLVTQDEIKKNHSDEYDNFFEEAKSIIKNRKDPLTGIYSEDNQRTCTFEGLGYFEKVYACTKIISKYYKVNCLLPDHHIWDVPLNENDEKWFDSHEIVYDKNKCYLGSYLFACYRSKRDSLDVTGKLKGDVYGYFRGKMADKYKQSPFYNRMLKTYKCI